MLKVNAPEIRAAPTMSAILVSKILFMAPKSVAPFLTNCSISVMESPTKLGARTANTREDTVKKRPNRSSNR